MPDTQIAILFKVPVEQCQPIRHTVEGLQQLLLRDSLVRTHAGHTNCNIVQGASGAVPAHPSHRGGPATTAPTRFPCQNTCRTHKLQYCSRCQWSSASPSVTPWRACNNCSYEIPLSEHMPDTQIAILFKVPVEQCQPIRHTV